MRDETPRDVVTVTARRREEALVDTPVTVTAFSPAALERQQAVNLVDLSGASPNLYVAQTGGSASAAQIFIRGVGNDSLGFNTESAIGVYLDDVYLGRVQGGLVDLLAIERIEVLRGPQGTLYGRNATGGAVKYVLEEPDLQDASLAGEVTVGSFERADVRVSASAPLIDDVLAVRFDASARSEEGYVEGVGAGGNLTGETINGVERTTVRAAVRYAPNARFDIEAAADVTRDRSGISLSTPLSCGASGCSPAEGDPYRAFIAFADEGYFDGWGANITAEYDFDGFQFRSITAYRALEEYAPIDLSGSRFFTLPIQIDLDQNQTSQEFQLVSTGERALDWIVGAFFFAENARQDANFLGARRNQDDQEATSAAIFGEATFSVSDRLALTFGGRYTADDKSIDRTIIPAGGAPVTAQGEFDDTQFSWKLGADFEPTPDSLLYASFSTGYKPGGFGSTWPTGPIDGAGTVESEESESYEVGYKRSLAGRRGELALAAYWTEYNNLQQGSLSANQFIVTSSDVRTAGVEIEGSFNVTDQFLIFGNAGYLDDEVTRSNIPGDNLSRALRYAPELQAQLGAEYRAPVFNGEGFLGVIGRYQSETAQDQANSASLLLGDITLFQARIGYEDAAGRFRIQFAGQNLTDEDYWRSGVPNLGRFYAKPRTFSLTLSASF
ncbi:MAG: TonB-dependent receptor [Oceanicaulis sp.]